MKSAATRKQLPGGDVTAYKRILAAVIDRRPSGTRQRLAAALTKNRSFVSQITNPQYLTPIPASHIETILDICHFSPAERQSFLEAYNAAHPRRLSPAGEPKPATIDLPDLGNAAKNARLHMLVSAFVRDIMHVIETTPPRRTGR